MSDSIAGAIHPGIGRILNRRAGLRALSARSAIAMILLGAHAMSPAGTIYKWTDDQGKVHYSDVVPEKFRSAAKPVAADALAPTSEERQEALARAAADKARTSASAPSPQASTTAASRPSAPRRPAQLPKADTDCDTWARLYNESLECFGPYRTARGATRPEAFAHCSPVDAPPSRCRQYLPESPSAR